MNRPTFTQLKEFIEDCLLQNGNKMADTEADNSQAGV